MWSRGGHGAANRPRSASANQCVDQPARRRSRGYHRDGKRSQGHSVGRRRNVNESFPINYRPASYWHASEAILANVKGEHRRQAISNAIATGTVDELPAGLLADDLPVELRRLLASLHPSLMGGEYLPDAHEHEVEIARVTLPDTVTCDVVSVRARPARTGIAYRIVDEYQTVFRCRPERTKLPLTFRQLIRLIDTTVDVANGYCGLVVGMWNYFVEHCGQNPAERPEAVVTSDFYPDLKRWYVCVAERWDRERSLPQKQ